jgi:hypothetical protein
MSVVAISWDQSLKREANPIPRTVRLSHRTLREESRVKMLSPADERWFDAEQWVGL